MSNRFRAMSVAAICAAALLAQHAIARETAATVLPQVKALHLRVFALTADVPKACRVFPALSAVSLPTAPTPIWSS